VGLEIKFESLLLGSWFADRAQLATAIRTAPRTSAVFHDRKMQLRCQLETSRGLLFSEDSAMSFWREYGFVKVLTPDSKHNPGRSELIFGDWN